MNLEKMEALLLQAKSHLENDEPREAAKVLGEALGYYDGQEGEGEGMRLAGECHHLLGIIQMEDSEPAMAMDSLVSATHLGCPDAYVQMGRLLYDGDFTPDYEPDIPSALDFWKTGMELGVKECGDLYEEHKDEVIPDPEDPQEFTTEEGDGYVGDIDEEGLPHGSGSMTYGVDCSPILILGEKMRPQTYTGMFEHGARSGYGMMDFVVSGKGLYSFTYRGQWKEDLPDGKGKAEKYGNTTTETYEGQWKAGLRHGQGSYYLHWDKGTLPTEQYDGEWVEDKKEGRGTCSYAHPYPSSPKEYYKGEWKGGKRCGHGTWESPDGSVFEGEWRDGGKDGPGTYKDAGGMGFTGIWKDGDLVLPSVRSGDGRFLGIAVKSSGFDYDYTSKYLLPLGVGTFTPGDCIPLDGGKDGSGKEILTIEGVDTDGTVHFTVPGTFTKDGEPACGTIAPGQEQTYGKSARASATIYGETHDYTTEDIITITYA